MKTQQRQTHFFFAPEHEKEVMDFLTTCKGPISWRKATMKKCNMLRISIAPTAVKRSNFDLYLYGTYFFYYSTFKIK